MVLLAIENAIEKIQLFLKPAALLFLFWTVVSLSGLLDPFLFPNPIQVTSAFLSFFYTFEVIPHLFSTISKIAFALAFGSAAGIIFSLLIQANKEISYTVSPLVDFFRSIPAAALFPLFLLVLGVGDATNTALATWICFLYIAFHAMQGLKSTSETSLDVAKSLKKKELEVLLKVRFPEALPVVFLGIRTAASLSVVVVILVEMFVGTTSGLGRLLIDSAYTYEIPKLYALILIVGLIGTTANSLIAMVENKLVHWKTK
ncbi:ABC transporter permease subunit [Candidatus Micrarchaeota archaeon]|nr:ABC transporter permease subunit [Candidatus Micrarchaeota archaeon]